MLVAWETQRVNRVSRGGIFLRSQRAEVDTSETHQMEVESHKGIATEQQEATVL